MLRLLSFVFAALVLPAHAGEPLATEDASVLAPGTCQVEAWHRYQQGVRVGWGVPACGVTDYLELGVGYGRHRDDDLGSHALALVQAKGVFHQDPAGRWSAGAVAGALHDAGRTSQSGFQQAYALALATFNLRDDTVRAHVNAGVVHSRSEYTTGAWGAAFEYVANDAWTLMGEVFRDGPGRPSFQLGARVTVVTDRVELFVSGGDRMHGDGTTWFAKLGARIQTWKLF